MIGPRRRAVRIIQGASGVARDGVRTSAMHGRATGLMRGNRTLYAPCLIQDRRGGNHNGAAHNKSLIRRSERLDGLGKGAGSIMNAGHLTAGKYLAIRPDRDRARALTSANLNAEAPAVRIRTDHPAGRNQRRRHDSRHRQPQRGGGEAFRSGQAMHHDARNYSAHPGAQARVLPIRLRCQRLAALRRSRG